MGEHKIVVFSLNNQVFGADILQVWEIIRYQDITRLPKLPAFIEGIINLRGKVVPVVNLNKRFGLGETGVDKKTKIIITLIEGKNIGFIVNDVSEIIEFSENEIEPPPDCIYSNENKYIKNIAKQGEKLISILDLSKILDDSEIKSLSLEEEVFTH